MLKTNELEERMDDVAITVKSGSLIFVTIGVPFSNIPIMQKVMIYVEPTVDTPVTAAKKLRKQIADNIESYGWVKGTNFTPAELYYEIYARVDNNVPFAMSFNSRYRKEHIDGSTSQSIAESQLPAKAR
jgi:hypothetical protein